MTFGLFFVFGKTQELKLTLSPLPSPSCKHTASTLCLRQYLWPSGRKFHNVQIGDSSHSVEFWGFARVPSIWMSALGLCVLFKIALNSLELPGTVPPTITMLHLVSKMVTDGSTTRRFKPTKRERRFRLLKLETTEISGDPDGKYRVNKPYFKNISHESSFPRGRGLRE